MTDGTIKGTGNSRYLKSVADFLTQYPNYEAFAQAMMEGTLPIDLNGINVAGWTQQGTALNKANLLSDATATNIGLTAAATPDQALNKLDARLDTAESNASNAQTKAAAALPKAGGAMTGTLSNTTSAQVRNIQVSTADLTAGTSTLTTGTIYLVYE